MMSFSHRLMTTPLLAQILSDLPPILVPLTRLNA
jgi:hypothetical protein